MAGVSGAPMQGANTSAGSNVFAMPSANQNQGMNTLLGGSNTGSPLQTLTQTVASANPQQNVANFNQQQNMSNFNQQPGNAGLGSLIQNNNNPVGGKGGGNMQPQATAMGTPIVYGNTYLPQSNTVVNTPAPVIDTSNSGGYDGAPNFYAYGTTSVKEYAGGTTDAEDDPWNWTKKDQVAPLSASIKPSEASVPAFVPDKTEQFLGNQAMAMGTNAAAKGIDAAYKAYNAPLTTQAAGSMGTTASGAPVALTNAGALSTPAAVVGESGLVMPTLVAPVSTGAGLGISTASAAPIGAGIGEGLGIAGAATEGAALAGAGATAAGTAATTGAAGAAAGIGGEAALAALGPVGMVIGGALLAKKLGIF